MGHFLRRASFLLIFAGAVISHSQAQPEPYREGCTFVPGGKAHGFELVTTLCQGWRQVDPSSGASDALAVPQADLTAAERVARIELSFTAIPLDTLWLYFEGIAGQSSITWNGQLLDLTDHPLADHLLALPPSLIRLGANRLVVRMRKEGKWESTDPDEFTGLYRGTFLLKRSKRQSTANLQHPPPKANEITAVYAPWSAAYGPNVDSTTLLRHLIWLRAYGATAVHFPFRPANRLRAQVLAFGLQVVDTLHGTVIYFNAYPHADVLQSPYWIDEHGRSTQYIGRFTQAGVRLALTAPRSDLLLMAVLALAILLAWKLTDPASFSALLSWNSIARRAYEQIVRGVTLRGVPVILITTTRLLLLATALQFLALELRRTGAYAWLPVHPDSLIGRFVRMPFGEEWSAFFWLLALLACWLLAQQVVMGLLGSLYGYRRLPARLLLAQALASLPSLLAPLLLSFVLVVGQPSGEFAGTLSRVAIAMLGAYAALYVALLLRGLTRLIETPLLVNLVYLCGLEVLPWIWLG